MKLKELSSQAFVRFPKFMISSLWGNFYALRRYLYRTGLLASSQIHVPVISVGNLSFGGTGKTPVIMKLVEYFNSQNKKIVVLTRGYKGELEKKGGVILPQNVKFVEAKKFGDEPILIATRIKQGGVVVGKKRFKNFVKHADSLSPEIILLDDGFQHLNIRRNLNLVLFDATLPLEHYAVPPIGYLRESMEALRDADVCLISRVDQVNANQREALKESIRAQKDVPIFEFYYQYQGYYNYRNQLSKDIFSSTSKKAIALAALASPASFFKSLEKNGIEIAHRYTFLDHHQFNLADVQPIIDLAEKENIPIICSEKDMAKLKHIIKNDKIFYPLLEIKFVKDEELFFEMVESSIEAESL